MSAREVPGKKYVVCLSAEEREQLQSMIRKEKLGATVDEGADPAESRRF